MAKSIKYSSLFISALIIFNTFSVTIAYSAARSYSCSYCRKDADEAIQDPYSETNNREWPQFSSPFIKAVQQDKKEALRLLSSVNLRKEIQLALTLGGQLLVNDVIAFVIENDEKSEFEEDISCLICFESFVKKTHEVEVTPCGHCFCKKCLTQWTHDGHKDCPCCRSTL